MNVYYRTLSLLVVKKSTALGQYLCIWVSA